MKRDLKRSSLYNCKKNSNLSFINDGNPDIQDFSKSPELSVCNQFSSVYSLSRVWLFATPWTAARQASLSITTSWSLLRLMSIDSVIPSNHLIFCHSLLLLPSIFPRIRVFSNESVLCQSTGVRWPKYWSFSFSIIPSKEIPGLISFRMEGLPWLWLGPRNSTVGAGFNAWLGN